MELKCALARARLRGFHQKVGSHNLAISNLLSHFLSLSLSHAHTHSPLARRHRCWRSNLRSCANAPWLAAPLTVGRAEGTPLPSPSMSDTHDPSLRSLATTHPTTITRISRSFAGAASSSAAAAAAAGGPEDDSVFDETDLAVASSSSASAPAAAAAAAVEVEEQRAFSPEPLPLYEDVEGFPSEEVG